MLDAIDELVARSKEHAELQKFHKFHRSHPEVLDFLVAEIRLLAAREGFSFASLWHYSRWKLKYSTGPSATYAMNDHLTPLYARAILILHPDLNGRAEMRGPGCIADKIFGTRLARWADKRPGDYSRRLEWADGISLENGWRPKLSHVVKRRAIRRPDIHDRSVTQLCVS
jgi:hypothetical protein